MRTESDSQGSNWSETGEKEDARLRAALQQEVPPELRRRLLDIPERGRLGAPGVGIIVLAVLVSLGWIWSLVH